MAEEFSYNQQLRRCQNKIGQPRRIERRSKEAKNSQQNTQQSQLINQRKNNLPPQNFESNEDSLDGFDLAEFDPR